MPIDQSLQLSRPRQHETPAALALAQSYKPAAPRTDVKVAGAGGVALFQKIGVLPVFRAEPWGEWGRAHSVFTDPSAAGVAAAVTSFQRGRGLPEHGKPVHGKQVHQLPMHGNTP